MTESGLYVPVGQAWQGLFLFDGDKVVADKLTVTGELVAEDLRLSNTVWTDLRVPATQINPTGSISPPALDNQTGLLDFSASATNVVSIVQQMPHEWKEGSDVSAHVHWRKKTAGAGNVIWLFEYEVQNIGAVFEGEYPNALMSSIPAVGTDDGSALKHLLSSFGNMSMTGKTISAIFTCKVSRLGGHVNDTYAGLATLLEFDIHYQIDSLGSRSKYEKDNDEEPA
jgi:hypothetical protein